MPSQSACLARRRLWIYLLAKSPNPAVSTLAQGDEPVPVQDLGAASLPNLNRMRHQGFHKSINSLLFITENRQFHKFIIITMILTPPHDSAIRWEEVLRVLQEVPLLD